MAKIIFEIEFDNSDLNLSKDDIDIVISEIEKEYDTECDEIDCYTDESIETFFDVCFDYIKEPDNHDSTKKEIMDYLDKLAEKYPKVGLTCDDESYFDDDE